MFTEQYPKNTEKTALQWLQKQEKYFANRPLQDPEHNDAAEYLAIGDSTFHDIKLEQRGQYGEAPKCLMEDSVLRKYTSFAPSASPEPEK